MKTEIKVGFFVFISFFLLILGIAYLGRSTFRKEGKEFEVTFNFLNDLKEGADVKFAGGIIVGYVKKIQLENNKIKVKIWVQKDFPITSNIEFSILGEGFLGEKYINVIYRIDYPDKIVKVSEGAVVRGKDPVSFDNLLDDVKVVSTKVSELLDNINFILGGITKRKDIEKISSGAIRLLKETEKIIASNKDNITLVIKEVVQGVKSMNNLLSQELPTIMRNTNVAVIKASRDLTGLVTELNNILSMVKRGEGIVGKLLVDRKLAKQMEEIILNLREVSERLLLSPLIKREKKERKFIWER